MNIQERVFPKVIRVTVIIRMRTTIIRYVVRINRQTQKTEVISEKILEENLPELTESEKGNIELKEEIEAEILNEQSEEDKANKIETETQD